MSIPLVYQQEISTLLNKEEIVLATVAQIMKDLSMFGIQINFSGDIKQAYSELHRQLVEQTDHLIQSAHSKLISVLYRIDISEKALLQANKDLPDYNEVERIAHVIIERELKKVLTRMYYKPS